MGPDRVQEGFRDLGLNVTFPDVARVGSEDSAMADAVKDVSPNPSSHPCTPHLPSFPPSSTSLALSRPTAAHSPFHCKRRTLR